MGKDAILVVHGDRIQLDLINPTRDKIRFPTVLILYKFAFNFSS